MNKTAGITTAIIVIIVALFGGYWLMTRTSTTVPDGSPAARANQTSSVNSDYSTDVTTNTNSKTKGSVYFSVTDAAANMGNVTGVAMTIDKVDMYSDTQGWITISEVPQIFNLLELKAKQQSSLLARADVAVDSYTKIRLHVAKVIVTESGQTKAAKLPANDLQINGLVNIKDHVPASVKIDVLADQSVHKTTKGEVIFAPVVNFESRSNASVQIGSGNIITISGGNVDDNQNAGMDIDGQVKSNFHLNLDTKLKIDGDTINLIGGGGAKSRVQVSTDLYMK